MFQRIKAVVTRSVSTNRPEEAVGPDAWLDGQYSRQIRRKHVSTATLCFMAGITTPIAIGLFAIGIPFAGLLVTVATVLLLSIALPDIRKLTHWQWIDRRRALDTQEECIDLQCELAQLREQYRDLHFNYCILSEVFRQTSRVDEQDDLFSAEIIHIRGERRDH